MLLELAAFNLQSVETGRRCGVERIELCQNYRAGGLSPDEDFFKAARKKFSGELLVMIRPRQGDFHYTEPEISWMLQAIKRFDEAGADGFVLGCLKEKTIELISLERLVQAAGKKPVTFHRAIDEVENYQEAIKLLISSGCRRVLTSGKSATALDGILKIKSAQQILGCQVTIVAGGGVRSTNIHHLMAATGLTEFHSAAVEGSEDQADEQEIMLLLKALKKIST